MELFRDKNRDRIAERLSAMGIEATMLERGRAEEQIRKKAIWESSLGIIQLAGDQITGVNVVRIRRRGKSNPAQYRAIFGIPDPTLPVEHHPLKIMAESEKSFPVFGKMRI